MPRYRLRPAGGMRPGLCFDGLLMQDLIECPLGKDADLYDLDRQWYPCWAAPFDAAVPAGETKRIDMNWPHPREAALLDAYAPHRFIVGSASQPHFDIVDLLFDGHRQLMPGPAAMFDGVGDGTMYFPRCWLGAPIVLVVRNTSQQERRLIAALVGAVRLAPGVTWKAFWATVEPLAQQNARARSRRKR